MEGRHRPGLQNCVCVGGALEVSWGEGLSVEKEER